MDDRAVLYRFLSEPPRFGEAAIHRAAKALLARAEQAEARADHLATTCGMLETQRVAQLLRAEQAEARAAAAEAERDRLIEAWRFERDPIEWHDGECWARTEGGDLLGPFATEREARVAAVRAAAGLDGTPPEQEAK